MVSVRSCLLALVVACTGPPAETQERSEPEPTPVVPAPETVLETLPPEVAPPVGEPQVEPASTMTLYAEGELVRSDRHESTNAKRVTVPAFEIDDASVTRAEFDACVASGACPRPTPCKTEGEERVATAPSDPVTCIDLFEAEAYCAWKGKQIPDEDQWERARPTWEPSLGTLTQWVRTRPCERWREHCGRSDFTVDGLREPVVTGRDGGLTPGFAFAHHGDPELGFRCVRAVVASTPPRAYPGPCWASCDGCESAPDERVEVRHVARWSDKGDLVDLIELSDEPVSTTLRAQLPRAMLAAVDASHVVARDPSGRIVGADVTAIPGRHYFRYDADGNVVARVTVGAAVRQHWQYHYGCWDERSRKRPHPDVLACPHPPTDPIVAPNAEFGRCVAGPKGGWDLAFEDVEVELCEGADGECESDSVSGSWALRYRTREGMVVTAESEEFTVDAAMRFDRIPIAAFDYDGDGHQEIVLTEAIGFDEDTGPEISVWTMHEGAVVPYAHAADIEGIEEVLDVDRDHRPDLLALGLLGVPPTYILGDDCNGGVVSVFRSNPDGTFTPNPATTRKRLAKQCHGWDKSVLGRSRITDGNVFRRLACMHLRGATQEDLLTRLTRELPRARCGEADFCACDTKSYEEFVAALPDSARGLLGPGR